MNTAIENAIVAITRKVPAVRPRDEQALREILTELAGKVSPVTYVPSLTADEISLIRDAFKAKVV